MGILFFAPRLDVASELWMRRLLKGLSDDIECIASTIRPNAICDTQCRYLEVVDEKPLIIFRLLRRMGLNTNLRPNLSRKEKLILEVERPKISVVFVQYLTLAVEYADVWRNTGKPVFVHCHGFDITWDLRQAADPEIEVHAPNYANAVKSLTKNVKFVVNSRHSMNRLLSIGIQKERIYVNYFGVISNNIQPAKLYSKGILKILYLGRLVDCKGPDLLIRAFELASSSGLSGTLVIAGDGPLRVTCELLKARSQWKERIEILGSVDPELGERLRAEADIFSAHSCLGPVSRQVEAFGVAFVEALAAGLPVVTGNSGGIAEIVQCGYNGILFNPGDIEAQAQAFLRLGQDVKLRAEMSRNAWLTAKEQFSFEQAITELRQILLTQENYREQDVH